MFKNYFKTAWRHLWRHKTFTVIHIAGLGMGMACAMLAFLFVHDEISFDDFQQNAPQLYRLTTTITDADNDKQTLGTSGQVQGPAFKAAIPEIADYVRIFGMNDVNFTANNKALAIKNIYADTGFFHVFSFPLLHGNAAQALANPNSIVLSQNTAVKFFGTDDIVGNIIQVEEGGGFKNLVVSGVAKNPPSNSSIQFDAVVPFSFLQLIFKDDNWLNQYLTTFILLKPFANSSEVETKFSTVFTANAQGQLAASGSAAKQFQFGLSPITAIHLNPMRLTPYGSATDERGLSNTSSSSYSYVLTAIVAFIVLMACINFINLTIGAASGRSKEIGIKKIVGGSRRNIVLQFLTEALIVCLFAFFLAFLTSACLLPLFNQLSGKNFHFSDFIQPGFFLYGVVVIIACILLSGIYPALKLSSFNPVQSLLNNQKTGVRHYIGKALIVCQFTLATGLIIAACVYFKQMEFIAGNNPGYNPENIIKFHLPPQRINESVVRTIKNELLQHPSIEAVTNEMGIGPEHVTANAKQLAVKENMVDASYLSTLGISLKEGRNFYANSYADSVHSILVNETFVKSAGFENAVGQQVKVDDHHTKTIIGVIKDYHYASLKENIEPEILTLNTGEDILVKIKKGEEAAALPAVNNTFKKMFPGHFYKYQFLDDYNATAYQTDTDWQQIILYSSVIAIVICCIGLFGLSVFVAQQRLKEIGIRKVLGASVTGITVMLMKDFLKFIIVSIFIASGPTYLIMSKWLQGYAYRIEISGWIFMFAGMLTILIAIFTVSFQAISAATANPLKSLKTA
ncbi:MAG TPA: ABC transporter permease [Panacibacter sp.]|nr:ABC transporter permease [Panacibacter sp.]HNP42895.1 ABC transporter permease [Panacibacter sp.]